MNDKLKEYRDASCADLTPAYNRTFREGFAAAIQLNLAVEFAEWATTFCHLHETYWFNPENDKRYTNTELYNYWMDNVWAAK